MEPTEHQSIGRQLAWRKRDINVVALENEFSRREGEGRKDGGYETSKRVRELRSKSVGQRKRDEVSSVLTYEEQKTTARRR